MRTTARASASQPNIVLIMSDEHDPGVTGCYGDPIIETPHLDRLAREGITFDACYTTSPLCAPARLSFTAGKYISRCGAWANSSWLPSDDYPSIARTLQSAGYETYLCSKQHYDRTRRYGFTDILPELRANRRHKLGVAKRRHPDDRTSNLRDWQNRSADFHPGEDSKTMLHDRMVTARACEFLANWRKELPPFFLFIGHLAPHFPLIAPQELYDKYRGCVPMPEIPEGLLESLPTNYRQLRYGFGLDGAEPEVVRRGRELYWALVAWYDGQVGAVVDAVERSAAAENTVVIYTSDHGENKGDHGLWWKCSMYEHAARIPLIVRWPERWKGGQRRGGACSLVDLVQTIIALAGGNAPADWDGDSMLRWLDAGEAPWKDEALSEYYGHNIASGFVMYRRGPWKYVYHTPADGRHGAERELYNLEVGPKEFHNVAAVAEQSGRVDAMHEALVRELGYEPDEAEQRCRSDCARGYDRG
jgi:choline-sulfatase